MRSVELDPTASGSAPGAIPTTVRPWLYGAVYLGVSCALVYGVWDRSLGKGAALGLAMLVLLAVGHPIVGFLIGRWWAVLLPYAVAILAIPAGYPPGAEGETLPISFLLLYLAVVEGVLMVPGIGIRKLRNAPREESSWS